MQEKERERGGYREEQEGRSIRSKIAILFSKYLEREDIRKNEKWRERERERERNHENQREGKK